MICLEYLGMDVRPLAIINEIREEPDAAGEIQPAGDDRNVCARFQRVEMVTAVVQDGHVLRECLCCHG